ncbi:hypothetical protein R1flu_004408 [Riccia fluitans]|uniref:Reverse transcriptase Ty1/copia-type domain-containing protein n=1 Tax=Riccia fluitans TaxID=41844 RepID=A0ABD1YQ70_9MARC
MGKPMGRPPHDNQSESSMRRSSHVKSAPKRYCVWFSSNQVNEHDNEDETHALIMKEGESSSFEEAQNSNEKVKWSTAMRKEMKAFNDNTWEFIELPKGNQMIISTWVYKRKEKSRIDEKIFKAKLVTKGFTQQKGVDYD